MDDLLVFSDDKKYLAAIRAEIVRFAETLRLKLHPHKSVILPTSQGVQFLGYRIFPTHRLLAKANLKRFRRRIQHLQVEYARGCIPLDKLTQRIVSWIGHAGHADTYGLRERLFRDFVFCRNNEASASSLPSGVAGDLAPNGS